MNSEEYKLKNKESISKYKQEWSSKNPRKKILSNAKHRAKKFNLEFTITEEDIPVVETCPFLGIPLTFIQGQGRVRTNISLDRIDSTKGYVKGNVQIISDMANTMKSDATPEQLKTFAQNIMRIYD